jgi:hypothetical protein
VAVLVAVVTRASPLALLGTDALGTAAWIALATIVYCGTVFTILAEAFVVAAATLRFEGRDARAGSVLAVVGPRLGPLALWALVQMVVSTALSLLRDRMGRQGGLIGRAAASGTNTAWATLMILVVPVILYEQAGAPRAMRRSTQLFRQVWGQTLVGGFGLGIALSALTIAAVLVVAPLALLSIGFAVVVGVVLLVLVSLVGSVAGGALTAALYRYATTGTLPGPYRPEELAVRR